MLFQGAWLDLEYGMPDKNGAREHNPPGLPDWVTPILDETLMQMYENSHQFDMKFVLRFSPLTISERQVSIVCRSLDIKQISTVGSPAVSIMCQNDMLKSFS